MATSRSQVGLRRRGSRLSLALGFALLPGCFGLDEAESSRLDLHQQSSQRFYREGRLQQALQQADKALELEEDHVGMRLVRGYCLVRMGKALDSIPEVEEAIRIFDRLTRGAGEENSRSWLGSGQAHFSRALMHGDEMATIQRRLSSDFLDEDGRKLETGWLETEKAGRAEHLTRAEQSLRHVLTMENQADNVWAIMELVLVLNTIGGHEDEAVRLSHHALAQLDQQNKLSRNNLRKNASLTAAHSLELERRIEENLARERELREVVAFIEYDRGSLQAALEQFDMLEERQLITAIHHFNRADIRERMGLLSEAADDLEAFLRKRSTSDDYDDVARRIFARIDNLRKQASKTTPVAVASDSVQEG
ncbi:MAG: hypothetical protein DHS20C15_04820 [Planctomycetota bacterium]|nr:MAG: hypothetical protein DHS20C15_04820 [Planctomycetota bacterium]